MPAVIFFACLDLEQKSSFLNGHYLVPTRKRSLRPDNRTFDLNRIPGNIDLKLSCFAQEINL